MDTPTIFLMHAMKEGEWVGSFHPILVHFPIVLFTLTLVCDIFHYLQKSGFFQLGSWMLWAGTILAIPTVATGWEASKQFPPDSPDVFTHMTLALSLASYAILYSIFRIFVTRRRWTLPSILFLALSFALVTLTSWTSDKGGVLSHGETPFSEESPEPPK